MTRPPLPPSDYYQAGVYTPDQSVDFLMRRVLGSILQQADAELAVHDLTYVQWLPLYKLMLCEATTSASLARDLGIDPAAITRALDRLETKGMLCRKRSTTDRRVVHLALTDAGRAIAAKVPQALASVLNAHLSGFSHDECRLLIDMLRRMVLNGEALRAAQAPDAAPKPGAAN